MDIPEEFTVNYEQDGVLKVKEEKKEVLSKGAWATVLYSYRNWNAKEEEYGPLKATIRRYRRMQGVYRQQSKFNISSARQALQLSKLLEEWFKDEK